MNIKSHQVYLVAACVLVSGEKVWGKVGGGGARLLLAASFRMIWKTNIYKCST